MAEIITTGKSKQRGIAKRMIKKNTKVDLTPMVDLGFLLITFFVFTTTMSQPTVMKLVEPLKTDIETQVPESLTTTFLLDKSNRVYYAHGLSKSFLPTDYSVEGIRKVIQERKKLLGNERADSIISVIKPSDSANMQNFVDMLDEVAISNLKIYFVDDLSSSDKQFLASH